MNAIAPGPTSRNVPALSIATIITRIQSRPLISCRSARHAFPALALPHPGSVCKASLGPEKLARTGANRRNLAIGSHLAGQCWLAHRDRSLTLHRSRAVWWHSRSPRDGDRERPAVRKEAHTAAFGRVAFTFNQIAAGLRGDASRTHTARDHVRRSRCSVGDRCGRRRISHNADVIAACEQRYEKNCRCMRHSRADLAPSHPARHPGDVHARRSCRAVLDVQPLMRLLPTAYCPVCGTVETTWSGSHVADVV